MDQKLQAIQKLLIKPVQQRSPASEFQILHFLIALPSFNKLAHLYGTQLLKLYSKFVRLHFFPQGQLIYPSDQIYLIVKGQIQVESSLNRRPLYLTRTQFGVFGGIVPSHVYNALENCVVLSMHHLDYSGIALKQEQSSLKQRSQLKQTMQLFPKISALRENQIFKQLFSYDLESIMIESKTLRLTKLQNIPQAVLADSLVLIAEGELKVSRFIGPIALNQKHFENEIIGLERCFGGLVIESKCQCSSAVAVVVVIPNRVVKHQITEQFYSDLLAEIKDFCKYQSQSIRSKKEALLQKLEKQDFGEERDASFQARNQNLLKNDFLERGFVIRSNKKFQPYRTFLNPYLRHQHERFEKRKNRLKNQAVYLRPIQAQAKTLDYDQFKHHQNNIRQKLIISRVTQIFDDKERERDSQRSTRESQSSGGSLRAKSLFGRRSRNKPTPKLILQYW